MLGKKINKKNIMRKT